MAGTNHRSRVPGVWELAATQHGVISRYQLLRLGMKSGAIERRIASGRLHPVMRGVYAVGRPGVGQRGRLMAAVLSCSLTAAPAGDPASARGLPRPADLSSGPPAVLSHASAAELWRVRRGQTVVVRVS